VRSLSSRQRIAAAVLALLGAATLSACGNQSTSLQFGLKREDLNLAFQVAQPQAPAPISQLAAQPLPIPATSFTLGELPTVAPYKDLTQAQLNALAALLLWHCPAAPAGAVPSAAANPFITSPPTAGVYFQHNTGIAKLSTATITLLSLPYPHHTAAEVKNVAVGNKAYTTGQLSVSSGNVITYDVVETNPVLTVTTTYQVTANELDMVRTITHSSVGTVTFQPTPPITVMQFKGVGASWTSAGIDPSTDVAMYEQGKITAEKAVDVCGTMVDTYAVQSSEQITDLTGNYSYSTASGDPNVYYVATNYGGVMVGEHVDTATTFTFNKVVYTLTQKYDSTFDSIKPHPAGTAPPPPYP